MAEIGAQLREARTRARIEIAQMEAQTKIRAKYLRALENEEWELLPGTTYVKSFLKTYGDMLGIDGRALVAEYKRSQEPFSGEGDIGQLSKHTGGRINRNQGGGGRSWLIGLAVLLVVVVAAGAYALANRGGGADPVASDGAGGVAASSPENGSSSQLPAKVVSVTVTSETDGVTVCLRAGSRIVVPARELRTGQRTRAARGRAVIVTTDSRSIRLTVDGKRATLPSGEGPATFEVTERGPQVVTDASITGCRA